MSSVCACTSFATKLNLGVAFGSVGSSTSAFWPDGGGGGGCVASVCMGSEEKASSPLLPHERKTAAELLLLSSLEPSEPNPPQPQWLGYSFS